MPGIVDELARAVALQRRPRRRLAFGDSQDPFAVRDPNYVLGAGETEAMVADPRPVRVPAGPGSYGPSTPQSQAAAQAAIMAQEQWMKRERDRRRQAAITTAKLAGTTRRGGPSRGALEEDPAFYFDNQNHLVARRSPGVPRLRTHMVPGSDVPQMDWNPEYNTNPHPAGRLVVYETPRRLTNAGRAY
jgi:hypothetical protein